MLKIYDDRALRRRWNLHRGQAALLVGLGVVIGVWLTRAGVDGDAMAAPLVLEPLPTPSCETGSPHRLRLDCELRLPLALR